MAGRAVVVGAGIGGLAAARVLRDDGFEVRVLERNRTLDPLGAGVTLWPNAMRVLRRIGGAEGLPGPASPSADAGIRRWDGKVLARTDLARIADRYGEPVMSLQRSTLHRALLSAGIGDLVETGAEVTRVSERGDRVEVECGRGETLEADLVIGADGIRSTVRAHLLGDGEPRHSGVLAYRSVIEMPPMELGPTEYWGPRRAFGLVPIDGGRLYWFATRLGAEDEPAEPDPIAGLLERHRDWAPEIAAAIEATPPESVLRHALLDRKPARRWCGERVALLGDAAHPMLPYLGQGACQAIEDAEELAAALRGATGIPAGVDDYQRRRARRTARVVSLSRQMGRLIHLRGAAPRALRDRAIALVPESVRLRQLDPIVGRPS
jgi:2-polyprenyl-6-methoxyphenol hydroxylase-like FAD-dependent oxidoreductase